MLGDPERKRYGRQLAIDGFGEAAQERLKGSSVFIAGAGGLGCAAALYLAAAGVGRIALVDNGRVELSNLNRQILYSDTDIGLLKVDAALHSLSRLNPATHVIPLAMDIRDSRARDAIFGFDVVIDALDNFPSRLSLNKIVVDFGIPLIHGAVDSFSGQMMVVMPRKSPCLMCLYRNAKHKETTPVIGTAAGVIGVLLATETIKLIASVGESVPGRLLFYDGVGSGFTTIDVKRDPECPHCGRLPASD
jgi:adenylyltransferase/sulfurtransferase